MTRLGLIRPAVNAAVQTLLDEKAKVQVDTYAAGSHIWTKPSWAKTVQVFCLGSAGGGGSGRKGAAGSVRCGGGGGGSPGYGFVTLLASELPSTVPVFVGAGGAGGAAQATNSTNGSNGSPGVST
jgi:hypothetical protein